MNSTKDIYCQCRLACYFKGYEGHRERFAHILMLHDVVLALPVSVCERGFSCLSRIKTDWRSFLKVDKLMLVSLKGPTMQDFSAEGLNGSVVGISTKVQKTNIWKGENGWTSNQWLAGFIFEQLHFWYFVYQEMRVDMLTDNTSDSNSVKYQIKHKLQRILSYCNKALKHLAAFSLSWCITA